MKLAILALDGCMDSAITGIADILSLANHVMKLRGSPGRFMWQILSLNGKAVRSGGGRLLQVDGAIGRRLSCEAIIVPGSLIDHATAERLAPQYEKAAALLRQHHATGRLIGAFCSGVFLLGAAGLLDAVALPSPGGCKASSAAATPKSISRAMRSSPLTTGSFARQDRCRGSISCCGSSKWSMAARSPGSAPTMP